MSAAWMTVSAEVLHHLLRLPADCEIIASGEADNGTVSLLLDGSCIPDGAVEVSGRYSSVHGHAIFEAFDVVRERKPACEACGN